MIRKLVTVNNEWTGRRISGFMRSCDMSVQDIADYCMVRTQTVYKWRTGRTLPSIDQIATLAKLFRVPIDDLLAVEERVVAK